MVELQRTGVVWVGAVASLVALGCSGGAQGEIVGAPMNLSVGPSASDDFASIGEAIAAATPDSTIVVATGTYTEALFVDKALTIVGSGVGTVVEFPANGPADSAVIEIRDARGVRIENLLVRASRLDVDGIRVRDSTDVVLDSVVAEGNSQDGVDVKRSAGVTLHMARFTDNGADGLQIDESSSDVTVTDCRAESNQVDGFKIRASSNVVLEGNTSTLNLDDGILVRDSSAVRLTGNTVTNNGDWGITVQNSPDTALENNAASGNGDGQIRCEPTACAGP
ncbi:MAG TPA: right-handed parallel beta-helix repeat-containing protein [Candidatus Polarisedimenticolaceae bacterium]|nr:right-handed parallel beta-helix repeat-containing protein [Candidatus Polarisedimenticolaceae bacterium]